MYTQECCVTVYVTVYLYVFGFPKLIKEMPVFSDFHYFLRYIRSGSYLGLTIKIAPKFSQLGHPLYNTHLYTEKFCLSAKNSNAEK